MQNLKTEPVMQEFTTPQMCIDERNQEFKSLVQDVAERLGQDDVTAFVFQCDLPLTFRTSMRQPTGLDLLMQLERDGLFSPGKIAPLADLLMKIHRCDLVTHYIDSYLQRYPDRHSSMPIQKSPPMTQIKKPRSFSADARTGVKGPVEETAGQVDTSPTQHTTDEPVPVRKIEEEPEQMPPNLQSAPCIPYSQELQEQAVPCSLKHQPHSYPQTELGHGDSQEPVLNHGPPTEESATYGMSHTGSSDRLGSHTHSPSFRYSSDHIITRHGSLLGHSSSSDVHQIARQRRGHSLDHSYRYQPTPLLLNPATLPQNPVLAEEDRTQLQPDLDAHVRTDAFVQNLSSETPVQPLSDQQLQFRQSTGVQTEQNPDEPPLSPPLPKDAEESVKPACEQFSKGQAMTVETGTNEKTFPRYQSLQWKLKRNPLNEAIYKHKLSKPFKCPKKLEVGAGSGGKANPRLSFKLYPHGLEDDTNINATLQVKIKVPKKCPRLSDSTSIRLTVAAYDVRESTELSGERVVTKPANLRDFLIPAFITHDDLKNSHSDHIEIQASAELLS